MAPKRKAAAQPAKRPTKIPRVTLRLAGSAAAGIPENEAIPEGGGAAAPPPKPKPKNGQVRCSQRGNNVHSLLVQNQDHPLLTNFQLKGVHTKTNVGDLLIALLEACGFVVSPDGELLSHPDIPGVELRVAEHGATARKDVSKRPKKDGGLEVETAVQQISPATADAASAGEEGLESTGGDAATDAAATGPAFSLGAAPKKSALLQSLPLQKPVGRPVKKRKRKLGTGWGSVLEPVSARSIAETFKIDELYLEAHNHALQCGKRPYRVTTEEAHPEVCIACPRRAAVLRTSTPYTLCRYGSGQCAKPLPTALCPGSPAPVGAGPHNSS